MATPPKEIIACTLKTHTALRGTGATDGKKLGSIEAILGSEQPNNLQIDWIGVDERYSRQGVASALLRTMAHTALKHYPELTHCSAHFINPISVPLFNKVFGGAAEFSIETTPGILQPLNLDEAYDRATDYAARIEQARDANQDIPDLPTTQVSARLDPRLVIGWPLAQLVHQEWQHA